MTRSPSLLLANATERAGESFVLDANILIAFLDNHDAHHQSVAQFLISHANARFAASAINVVESLVYPAMADKLAVAQEAFERLELTIVTVTGNDTGSIAALRAQTRMKVADACALHAAVSTGSMLVTHDQKLAAVARTCGVKVSLLDRGMDESHGP